MMTVMMSVAVAVIVLVMHVAIGCRRVRVVYQGEVTSSDSSRHDRVQVWVAKASGKDRSDIGENPRD